MAGLLTDCWRDFRALPWKWHLLALALLLGLSAAGAAPILRSEVPTIDEATYERAFADVAGGRSPYDSPGYYYPPAFAFVGATGARALGTAGMRLLLRWMNLVGAALTCWFAAAWWWSASGTVRARVTERLLVAMLLMWVAPGVGAGIATGNFSLAVSSWINVGLHAAHARPVLAGVGLGISLLAKPLAAIAMPVLAGAALAPPARRKISPVSVVIAGGVAAAGLLGLPYLREMLSLKVQDGTLSGTVSLLRVAHLLGIDLHQVTLLVLLTPLALYAGRRLATDRVALICVSLALVMFTSPATWPYTATVFFPVPVMAFSVARSRYAARGGPAAPASGARLELVLVAALSIAVLFVNGGAFDRMGSLPQIVLLLAQLAAPLLLAGYVLRSAAAWQSGAMEVGDAEPDRLST